MTGKIRKSYPPKNISQINELQINDFRQFNNIKIPIAKRITIISGHNATGKSTLLAILANSCELKGFKPLIKSSFRGEFPEIIRASQDHDLTKSNVLSIVFSDTDQSHSQFNVPFRATWQAGKRYRLIPKHNGRESKLGYPVIYLGLSRLYPLGECNIDCELSKPSKISSYLNSHEDEKKWMIDAYKNILNIDKVSDIDAKKHPDTSNKIFVGVKNNTYNELCNSAGQDNLGQILLALLSFQKAYDEIIAENKTWYGGLLLIDELDASLHPAAQIKLMDLLLTKSKELDLQIIFTTHSLSILNNFYNNKDYLKNDNEIIYLTTQNGDLDLKITPDIEYIRNDMLVIDPANVSPKKVTVFTEDKETRWFLNEIIPEHLKRIIELPNMTWGCQELATLNNDTYPAMKNILFVLDGDFNEANNSRFNVITLPGNNSPEAVIYNYLKSLPYTHPLLNNNTSLNKRTLDEYGPFSQKYTAKKARDNYKAWFNDNEIVLMSMNVISYWKDEHQDEIKKFEKNMLSRIKALQHL